MSALAQNITNQSSSESVTKISASARIDYILRFSKQAVLVVDEEISLSSDVGSQYLANLSTEHNASYISMSAKLNDLQVRCRIIEQLFGNILFDPEQSIAISIINLVKVNHQAVTIVIDNAHHLSLQLFHELTQLAEIAKKADYQINVLMLATMQAGQVVSQNYALFNKKLAIVAAQTGQLVSLNAKMFKVEKEFIRLTPFVKWLAFFVSLTILSALVIYFLYQRAAFSFSSVVDNQKLSPKEVAEKLAVEQSPQFVLDKTVKSDTILATSADVYQVLTDDMLETKQEKLPPVNALPIDILTALQQAQVSEQQPISADSKQQVLKGEQLLPEDAIVDSSAQIEALQVKALSSPITEKLVPAEIAADIGAKIAETDAMPTDTQALPYLGQEQGFVIQIAAFSQEKVLAKFLAEFPSITFHHYQKRVNGVAMTILTSAFFSSRELAESALSSLPQAIKQRSPWIKDISTINTEINEFQHSQSSANKDTIPNS